MILQGEKKKSTKRCPEKCNFCAIVLDGRGELLEKHILQKCPDVPELTKLQAKLILDARKQASDAQEREDLISPPKKLAKRAPKQSVADAKRPASREEGEKLLPARSNEAQVEVLRDDEIGWTPDAEQMRRMVACHVVPPGEGEAGGEPQPLSHIPHFPLSREAEHVSSGGHGHQSRHVAADPYPWPYTGDLRPQTTALLVMDMQKDFCFPGGYSDKIGCDINLAREIIPAIQIILDACRRLGFRVIHPRETYRRDLSNCPPPVSGEQTEWELAWAPWDP